MGLSTYQWAPSEVQIHEEMLEIPMKWKRPRMIFTNSMSDFFHEKVSFEFLDRVLDMIRATPQHTYQVLTKRSWRMMRYSDRIGEFPGNMWLGVSVESEKYKFRMEHLKRTHARTRFLSVEPLIGPIGKLDLEGIHWVIVGGESGANHRPCKVEWVREVRDQCLYESVPFFFKQWGGITPKSSGRLLDGKLWDEFPQNANRALVEAAAFS